MPADLFSDLGLADKVAAAAEEAGLDAPTSIQEAAIPLLRRGNNMVVVGAPGSGARTAILLALIDRLVVETADEPDEDDDEIAGKPRILILTPTADEAARAARSAARLGASSGVRARSLDRPEAWTTAATIACASATVALDAVRASTLKLDALMAIVLDGYDAMRALGQESAVDLIFAQLPAEAQRIVRSSSSSDALDDFAQRALRRAMRVPSRPADSREAPAGTSPLRGVNLSLVEVSAAGGHDALASLAARGPVRIHFRSSSDAAAAARELTTRGLDLERLDAMLTIPASLPSARDVEPLEVSFGAPADAATLAQRHRDGGALVVDPRELSHARALATETGASLRPATLPGGADSGLDAFRAEVRRALDEEDLASQLLVLEPLLAERAPAEVAAALSALLRARRAAAGGAGTVAARGSDAGAPPPAKSWTRIYIGIGKRDDVRAGDLVGAITGEANVTGEVIGKIDMRDNFSVVEVEASAAQHVIDSLNGRTLRGRAMRVDYDRQREGGEESGQRPRPGGEGGGRPPREGGGAPRGGGPRGGGGGGRPPKGGGGRPPRGGGSGGGRGGPREGGPGRGPREGGPGRGGPGRGGPRDGAPRGRDGGGGGGGGGGREGGRTGGGPGRGPQGPRRGPPRDRE